MCRGGGGGRRVHACENVVCVLAVFLILALHVMNSVAHLHTCRLYSDL